MSPAILRRPARASIAAAALLVALADRRRRAQNPTTITVDAAANRHPINPDVYGVAYATTAAAQDLNAPLNRYGGNNTSRYNWQLNADNRGDDWYFESIGDASADGRRARRHFVADSKRAGAQADAHVPIDRLGREARRQPRASSRASRSAKYGAQDERDWQWFADAGNGMRTNGQPVTGNDPNDANVPSNSRVPAGVGAAPGAALRARPRPAACATTSSTTSRASGTRRTATCSRPAPTMDEMREQDDRLRRARSRRSIPARSSSVPEEWGWSGYLFSGYDQQYGAAHGWSFLPDRAAHGGTDYLPWLLEQLRRERHGDRRRAARRLHRALLPAGRRVQRRRLAARCSCAATARRARCGIPHYVDETWINDKVQLIPRLQQLGQHYYYPGTPIGITEYNWGAESHINGATTQADIFGIFGREGLDIGGALDDARRRARRPTRR